VTDYRIAHGLTGLTAVTWTGLVLVHVDVGNLVLLLQSCTINRGVCVHKFNVSLNKTIMSRDGSS